MRIIFLGTPAFAQPTLEQLITWPKGEVVAVVCQPDRPAGRGHKLVPPPTKLVAQSLGIPVFQPERLSKAPEIIESMRALNPDILVMVAFGQILKKSVLEMAPHGVVNIHGSLLPKYRGPAPINWAIINGEKTTGITTMFSDVGVDTGKMLLKRAVPITADMHVEELERILSQVGSSLLIETLDKILAGTIQRQEQNESEATYAPLLKKDTGEIDWCKSADDIHNLVRGLYGWPGTYTYLADTTLKVISTRIIDDSQNGKAIPGQVIQNTGQIVVACGQGAIELLEVQPPSKARMKASDWANGVRLSTNTILGKSVQS